MAPRANLFLLKGKFTYKRVVLEQNQSFDEFPIGGVPIVCHFADPLVTKQDQIHLLQDRKQNDQSVFKSNQA